MDHCFKLLLKREFKYVQTVYSDLTRVKRVEFYRLKCYMKKIY
jgi:hypothetical protein